MKIHLITKEELKAEKIKAMEGENLGWPYLPEIKIIPKKVKKEKDELCRPIG